VRIIVISSRHHPGQGGVGACIDAFVRGMATVGWEVDLVTRQSEHLPPATRIHLVATPDDEAAFRARIPALRRIERIRPYRYGQWALAAAERLRQIDGPVDAVIAVDVQAEGYVAMRSRLVRQRFPGTPFLVAAHCPMFVIESVAGAEETRHGRAIYHAWERAALAAADGVVALSGLLGSAIAPAVPRGSIGAIPPVVPTHDRPPRSVHEPEIILIGDVAWHKGVDVWARSLNRVFRQVKDVRARLIGPDTPQAPGDRSLAAHVASLIDPRYRHRFRWDGPVHHAAALDAIDRAALIVVPSRFDSFSCVAAEAVLRRQPLVISDRVGIGEWIAGLPTVTAGQSEALAEAQIGVLRESATWRLRLDEPRRRLLAIAAPDRVAEGYQAAIESARQRSRTPDGGGGTDAMDDMRAFLADVEREEHRAGAVVEPASEGASAPVEVGQGNFTTA